ncbi:OLC1v1033518C2 [Oldenlandia corymbosa var. corymbosa]|uniref:OLC1v1033518C2 n=1 Tax=Oldenlandia corymbosa var. corymbosa TaxID=529605 RepID=A0AAV1CP71_OLDCO|nr:OLC1v1033518C2 [Oldenlandia corymbosa var. corymbosa]
MEEDKKKKKNKKKKNKQNAARINDTSPADGSVVAASVTLGKNQSTITTQVDAGPARDLHQDALVDHPEEDMQAVIQEVGNQESPLDKGLSMQKEVTLAGVLEQLGELQKEKEAHIQQGASLQEQISQLEKEKDAYTNKEADLQKKIVELEIGKEALVQKESLLEVKIGQMQKDQESWFHKEALLEEKINRLTDLVATVRLEKGSLEELVKQFEKERDSWILQENLTKEVISSLNGENSCFKSQVVELEELRNSLLQENHLLKETISDLQSRILNLERTVVSTSSSTEIKIHPMENGDVSARSKAASTLIEKSIDESSELVEKMNELQAELHDENPEPESSPTGNFAGVEGSFVVVDGSVGGVVEMHKADMIDASSDKINGFGLIEQTFRNDANNIVLFPDSSKFDESSSDEIVQIPLDEIKRESITDHGVPDVDVEKDEVSLTEAPLIGAPFRLISFVARYVSGADLVQKNAGG